MNERVTLCWTNHCESQTTSTGSRKTLQGLSHSTVWPLTTSSLHHIRDWLETGAGAALCHWRQEFTFYLSTDTHNWVLVSDWSGHRIHWSIGQSQRRLEIFTWQGSLELNVNVKMLWINVIPKPHKKTWIEVSHQLNTWHNFHNI